MAKIYHIKNNNYQIESKISKIILPNYFTQNPFEIQKLSPEVGKEQVDVLSRAHVAFHFN